MKINVKILIAEHDPQDLELILHEITASGIAFIPLVVHNEQGFTDGLETFLPDLILSDYTFPSFSGPEALNIRKRLAPDTPIIFVSGTIGEEKSIELIRNGLTDYALKDKLFSLAPKIVRAIKEAEEKQQKKAAEYDLMISEGKLARAQQLAHIGSWELDTPGGLILLSPEACRIYGLDEKEKGLPYKNWLSFIHPEDVDRATQKLFETSGSHADLAINYRILTANGSTRHIHNECKQAFDTNGHPADLYGTVQDVTEMVLLENKLVNERRNKQSEITAAVLTAQENERADIGQELYDDVNHVLSATKLYIELAKNGEADRKMLLEKSSDCIAGVIERISKISRGLSSPGKQVGLFTSIKVLIADVVLGCPINIQFRENNMKEKYLNENLKLTIFRIIQEQMNNILRHSRATNAVIRLRRRDNEVLLHISDNGSGANQIIETEGVGIQNIRSRAELYNGTVTVVSKPGKGLALKVALSLNLYLNKPGLLNPVAIC